MTEAKLLSILIEIESRVYNDQTKQFQKSLAKDCFLLVASRSESFDLAFKILVEKQKFSTLGGFVGRCEKHLRGNTEVHLQMLRSAERIGARPVTENRKAWKGLHFGHFAKFASEIDDLTFASSSRQLATSILQESLEKMHFGSFLSLLDEFPVHKVLQSERSLRDLVIRTFQKKSSDKKKCPDSVRLINELTEDLVKGAIEIEEAKTLSFRQNSELEVSSLRVELEDLGKKLQERETQIGALKEDLRKAGKSEIVALSTKLHQAQLQSLIGMCRLFEEVRIFVANSESKDSSEIDTLLASARRIMNGFGLRSIGTVGELLDVDRKMFEVLGGDSARQGTVIIPAYIRENESEVLVRGTLKTSP